MTPIGFHVVSRLEDNRVIAAMPTERRVLARVVLEKTRGHRLLAFNAADTHLHTELKESKRDSLELVRRIESSLHYRLELPVSFVEAYPEPIRKQSHLAHCFNYIMEQQPHHGLAWDPYHEASNLPDLLGLRLLGAHTIEQVRSFLPRVNRRQLLAYLGLESLEEVDGPLELIVPAALSAAGLNDLSGRTREQAAARRAILELAGGQVPIARLARQIGVSARTLFRTRSLPPDPRLVRAIRLQLGLRRLKSDARMEPYTAASPG